MNRDIKQEETTEVKGKSRGGNTGLPFGLCAKFGIALPENASPRDAWYALKEKTGLTPDKVYAQLKEKFNGLRKDKPESKEIATEKKVESKQEEPTKARFVENMNETQLNSEIESLERKLDYLGKVKSRYGGRSAVERGLQEQYPLGVGYGHGENYVRLERDNQRSVDNAVKFTEVYKEAERTQAKLDNYKKMKEQIAGTGKTYSEIKAEKAKQAELERASQPKTMEWKTTQKEKYDSTGYTPKIINAGDYSIRIVSGMDKAVYYKDKLIAYGRTINDAKAKAELHMNRMNKR